MDVRDEEFARLVLAEKPEIINHHAAQTKVGASTANPLYDAEVNVLGLLNLLESAVKAGVRKVIFASSGGTVYGTCPRLPIKEAEPYAPESPYGITKTASELYLRYYAANFGLRYTALRYANVFGPRDTTSSEHVITAFAGRMLRDEAPIIHWDGEQAKDYVYVDDVVKANLLALDLGDNEAFNIGLGRPISVNAIYCALSELLDKHVEPRYGPKRVGDVRLFYCDFEKAARQLGWAPSISFEEGLARTVAWYSDRLVAKQTDALDTRF